MVFPQVSQTAPSQWPEPPTPTITLQDLQRMLARRALWMALALILCVAAGLGWTVSQPRRYAAMTEIIASRPIGSSGADSAGSIPLMQDLQSLTRARSVRTQMRVMQSPDIKREALKSLSKDQQAFGQDAQVEVIDSRETDIISIRVTARDPDAAAAYANAIVTTYVAREVQQYRDASSTALTYLEEEIDRVGRELRAVRDRLAEYKRRTNLFSPTEMVTQRVRALTELEAQLAAQRVELAQAKRDEVSLQKALQQSPRQIEATVSEARNPQLARIEELIGQLEAQRAQLLQVYTPEAPEIRAVAEQISEARQRWAKEYQTIIASRQLAINPNQQALQQQYVAVQVRLAGLRARLQALQGHCADARSELERMTAHERNVTELLNSAAQLEATFQLLNQSYQTLRISQTARLPGAQVVSQAVASSRPVSPNMPGAVLQFIILGLIMALLLGLFLEWADDRIGTLDEAEQISGLSVMGQIPRIPGATLVHVEGTSRAMLESYRLLKGNLLFSNLDRQVRVLAVSSASSGEGKTTTSINLAIVMAMSGQRTLLIDSDFHRPSVQEFLQPPSMVGISNVITGNATLAEAIQPTAVDNMFVLTTGPLPPNPSDLLNSQSMRRLITELGGEYDCVILDSPPTLGLSDVPIISTYVDGLLLVVAARETHRQLLRSALRALRLVKAPLLGCVFNKASDRSMKYGGYYYYYHSSEQAAAEASSPDEIANPAGK